MRDEALRTAREDFAWDRHDIKKFLLFIQDDRLVIVNSFKRDESAT